MRTGFSPAQLADPHLAQAEASLRACVHCGFCTATCPTYVLLGDERDSPRGRIALMQNMLEKGEAPTAETVLHIDRCLSCLGCRTTCPSSVDYAVLIDTARAHIENTYRRPLADRIYRGFVLAVLTRPKLFGFFIALARAFAPLLRVIPGKLGLLAAKTAKREAPPAQPTVAAPTNPRLRIALLPGCVQRTLAPEIDRAAMNVLARQGDRADALAASGCCGALAFHMGNEHRAKTQARALMDAVEKGAASADAVLNTATGCTAFLKDYPRLFLGDPDEVRARAFAAQVKDFSELAEAPPRVEGLPAIAYHPPCSLQHGQGLRGQAEALLRAAGFHLAPITEDYLCCGSAGSYSLLQPDIAASLRIRKLEALKGSGAELMVTGNIGCLMQLSGDDALPAYHLAELLDQAATKKTT